MFMRIEKNCISCASISRFKYATFQCLVFHMMHNSFILVFFYISFLHRFAYSLDVRDSLIISTILGVVRMSMSVSSLSIVSRAVSYQHESFSWSWTNPDGNCASEEVL